MNISRVIRSFTPVFHRILDILLLKARMDGAHYNHEHASMPHEARKKPGITDDLIRLSIGLEDELIEDLDRGLNKIK